MNKQTIVQKSQEITKDRRFGKGFVIAMSRTIYRIRNTDVYYVESETQEDKFYTVYYEWGEPVGCACKDSQIRNDLLCKHVWATLIGSNYDTIVDVDRLPTDQGLEVVH